jgi:hypothetical protein
MSTKRAFLENCGEKSHLLTEKDIFTAGFRLEIVYFT